MEKEVSQEKSILRFLIEEEIKNNKMIKKKFVKLRYTWILHAYCFANNTL